MDETDYITSDKLGSSGDDFYQALMAAHDGLNLSQSHELNIRLVLMMANELSDISLLKKVLLKARKMIE